MLSSEDWIVYVGTYTQGASKGIYAFRYHPETGGLTPIGLAAQTVSPSFLVLNPNGSVLYSVNESRRYAGLTNSGSVSAFSIDPATARLTLLNTVASRGADPCHLVADRTGRWLFVANYSGGSIAVIPIREDGSLDEAQVVQHTGGARVHPRQEAPHVHSVDISPDNRLLYVSDLGLNATLVYGFDAGTGALTPRSLSYSAPGTGPRHLAFTPDRRFLYSLGELNSSVTAFVHDAAAADLREMQTVSTLPAGFTEPSDGAEIAVHPSGRFLYASNRGHDSISVYKINREGQLSDVTFTPAEGRTPRHFAIDPAGKHLLVALQRSSTIVTFQIDLDAGTLTPVGNAAFVPDPVCTLFVTV